MANNDSPYILEETDDFAVVFKPPKMHSVPNKQNNGDTLLGWYAALYPHAGEGGLIHRLDFETHGIVLFAKNKKSFDFLNSLQNRGEFIKEYSAVCVIADNPAPISGFPISPVLPDSSPSPDKPLVIESFFRPFGPGRKQVRPVIDDSKKHKEIAKDRGSFYRTEIIGISDNVFTVRIRRGFRHQIRCHLCWAGFPIQNDPLYLCPKGEGPETDEPLPAWGILALCAQALYFDDPSGGGKRECRISPIENRYKKIPLVFNNGRVYC